VQKRRLDLIQLLVEHGADIHSVDMDIVFEAWAPEIIEFFIEKGADLETGNPLAIALISRIRTALRIFLSYRDRFPSFQEQLDMALRHHCKEGNLKWVSLTLWAGADPFSRGPDAESQVDDDDPDERMNALEYAALYEHWAVFKIKKIQLNPDDPRLSRLLEHVSWGGGYELLASLLEKGFNPNDQANGGSSQIQSFLRRLSLRRLHRYGGFSFEREQSEPIDSFDSRDTLKAIHLLARHGGRWIPQEKYEVNEARRSLLKMKPEYTVEFIWIMSGYSGCTRSTVEELLRKPKMRKHLERFRGRVTELLAGLPEVLSSTNDQSS